MVGVLTYGGSRMAESVRKIGKRCAVGSASKTETSETVDAASYEPSSASLTLVCFLAFFSINRIQKKLD